MKKSILLMFVCLLSTSMFAQFKVDTNGFATSNDLLISGPAGVSSTTMPGVLTVKATSRSPNYNPYTATYPLAIICTKTITGSYPLINMNSNGQMTFYIDNSGAMHAGSNTVVTSDSTCKKNVSMLQPTMSKIKTLHGISFDYKEEQSKGRSAIEELPQGATPEISLQIAEEMKRKRIGLIAQEVEKVFPEVVRTSYDGTKGVMYADLVCVVIEGLKELQDSLANLSARYEERISALEQQLAQLTSPVQQNAPKASSVSTLGKEQAELYQNTPNPFNRETEIAYRLSSNATSASICIYNLNGQQLKRYPLSTDSANGSIAISASEFTSGMYIYALVINNQVIDSKRMTLTD